MTEVSEKKDVQKLQRIVVDSLEDVKAQDLAVFNTEHLSALFERVIIASGTSNRQTKALAANVRDGVRDGGFGKPRIEGEENGEDSFDDESMEDDIDSQIDRDEIKALKSNQMLDKKDRKKN
jgi:hypothetical protein